jgi:hypothetical protein
MNDRTKLILAIMQVENIIDLMKQNEWEQFMMLHLMLVKIEMERQLSNMN